MTTPRLSVTLCRSAKSSVVRSPTPFTLSSRPNTAPSPPPTSARNDLPLLDFGDPQLQNGELLRNAVSASPRSAMILPRLVESRKSLLASVSSLVLLLAYALFGGFIFLYFEAEEYYRETHRRIQQRYHCIDGVIRSRPYDATTALRIVQHCMEDAKPVEWNLRNSLLYGFGILTTLGYGKIETRTSSGRLFTVFYGFLGVPVTVIILTNLGLYLRRIEKTARDCCLNAWRNRQSATKKKKPQVMGPLPTTDMVSPISLAVVVVLYLIFGAIVMPLLNGKFEFINGLYYSYICFTAIEFGALVPENTALIPIVILYMCVGLAISTLAVEIGATYVKKLYYLGRRASNFSSVKIWFGSKQLQVTELLSALSLTIGIDPGTFSELDLEKLVKDAILVKEGKMERIPQAYIFLDGIWPPSLVPLFLRDGHFPEYVDADERRRTSIRKGKTVRTPSSLNYPLRLAAQCAYRQASQYADESDDEEEEGPPGTPPRVPNGELNNNNVLIL